MPRPADLVEPAGPDDLAELTGLTGSAELAKLVELAVHPASHPAKCQAVKHLTEHSAARPVNLSGKRLSLSSFFCLFLLFACLPLAACGSGTPPRIAVFALDGPPLAVAAVRGDIELLEADAIDAVDAGDMNYADEQLDVSAVEAVAKDTPDADLPSVVQSVGDAPNYRVLNEIHYSGEMERGCLAGIGRFRLENQEIGLICEGGIDSAPSRRGRIRGIVPCGNGEFFMFTLSHQGPDQGAGVGRFASGSGSADKPDRLNLEIQGGAPVLFFYHPWREEAERRLADMQKNLAAHMRDEQNEK